MSQKQSNPVSKSDTELIFRLLDIITGEIHRLFDDGMTLSESADEYELEKLQSKIASRQSEIQKLRQMISKTRGYIRHRKDLEKKRRSKTS